MMDALVKLAEQGTGAILATTFLLALVMGGYALFKLFPKFHGQAMHAFKNLTDAVVANTTEHREARQADAALAAERHTEVLTKLEEMHRDFLSEVADTKEYTPIPFAPNPPIRPREATV